MALPLSPSERQLAYRVLGVTDQELGEIERAPFRAGEELLKRLKARVRKTFKQVAHLYHPDQNAADPEKATVFSLLVRAVKELCDREAKAEPPGMQIPEMPPQPKWRIHTVTVPVSGTKPFMQAHVRRPQAHGSQRLSPREQATRLGKMRP